MKNTNLINEAKAVIEKYGTVSELEMLKSDNISAETLNSCPTFNTLNMHFCTENDCLLMDYERYQYDDGIFAIAQEEVATRIHEALHKDDGYFDKRDFNLREFSMIRIKIDVEEDYYEKTFGDNILKDFIATGELPDCIGEYAIREITAQCNQ